MKKEKLITIIISMISVLIVIIFGLIIWIKVEKEHNYKKQIQELNIIKQQMTETMNKNKQIIEYSSHIKFIIYYKYYEEAKEYYKNKYNTSFYEPDPIDVLEYWIIYKEEK